MTNETGVLSRVLLVVLFGVLAAVALPVPAATAASDGPAFNGVLATHTELTYRELRYTGVIGQTDWYTCGPAAVATLLHHYYGLDADEAAILQVALDAMKASVHDPAVGVTALALVRAFEAYGFAAFGYRLTPDALAAYFAEGGLPVILHVTEPEQHYVTAVGMVGHDVVIADPSWGRRIEGWEQFVVDKGFSGVALVPVPPAHFIPVAEASQRAVLAWADQRLQRLSLLGRRLS